MRMPPPPSHIFDAMCAEEETTRWRRRKHCKAHPHRNRNPKKKDIFETGVSASSTHRVVVAAEESLTLLDALAVLPPRANPHDKQLKAPLGCDVAIQEQDRRLKGRWWWSGHTCCRADAART